MNRTKDPIEYVWLVDHAGKEYCLRQLAEECSELTKASLKLIRANNGETPLPQPIAWDALIEELADTQVMLDLIVNGMLTPGERDDVERIYDEKLSRFTTRVQSPDWHRKPRP